MNLIPYSHYAHTMLGCEKRPFKYEFLDKPDTRPLDIQVPLGNEYRNMFFCSLHEDIK